MNSAQKVYTMLGNESLWSVAARYHELQSEAGIAYSVCGGVAVCLHGYQRNTTDLDLVIRSDDSETIRKFLSEAGFQWDAETAEFCTEDGIAVQFLIAGQKAGKGTEVSSRHISRTCPQCSFERHHSSVPRTAWFFK